MKRQDGFILLMVVAVLTVASAALAIASLSVRLGAKDVGVTIDLAQTRAAANAVLARTVLGLEEEVPIYADGRPYTFAINDVDITYWLVDTRGLIDLNGADETLLASFFQALGQSIPDADSLAAAIADWRDADNEERTKGAEERDYENAGLPKPGNRAFVDVSEVRGVLGMNAALYKAAAPYLTAGSGIKKPDPLTAPELILDLLPLSPTERNEILDQRRDGGAPPSLDGTEEKTKTDAPKTDPAPSGKFLILVEAELPSGTRQALRIVFATGPRPGEYAILSRRTLPFGEATKLYGSRADNVSF